MSIAYDLIRTYSNGCTAEGREQITLRPNSSYATSSVTNTTRTALQMNLNLRDEYPASYHLNYDTDQNFQYAFVLLSITSIKKNHERPFLNTNPFNCAACVFITRVKMNPQSFKAATIMVHTMAENIRISSTVNKTQQLTLHKLLFNQKTE